VADGARTPRRRYARLERERRWVLAAPPPALHDPGVRRLDLRDLYVEGTRLRLRQSTDLGTGTTTLKLGQKVPLPGEGPSSTAHTTTYLSAQEYALLRRSLPGRELHKTRHLLVLGGARLAVDAFHGPLHGLVTAEVELAEEAYGGFVLPLEDALVLGEVSDDPRYTGAALAALDPQAAAALAATRRGRADGEGHR
jgi:hypothetical protein